MSLDTSLHLNIVNSVEIALSSGIPLMVDVHREDACNSECRNPGKYYRSLADNFFDVPLLAISFYAIENQVLKVLMPHHLSRKTKWVI